MIQINWRKGNSRYYKIYLFKDMLNDWIVVKVWGGVNSKLGNYSKTAYHEYNDALNEIKSIDHIRTKRGYSKL